ncbi:hypothetical protein KCP75_00235 [Salmonella enterica subsp. enterica]|nr:hypothetical protein KCP75_00235 [Salmonella enterica subsp. enterica]
MGSVTFLTAAAKTLFSKQVLPLRYACRRKLAVAFRQMAIALLRGHFYSSEGAYYDVGSRVAVRIW